MNYKALFATIAASVTLFLCGCSSYTRVRADALPPIFVLSQQTVTSGNRVITLPEGIYKAHFQDKDGVYYRASGAMLQSAPSAWDLYGGLFIPHPEAKDQRQEVWLYGAFSELSRLSTKMTILKLNEKVDYAVRADQFLRQ